MSEEYGAQVRELCELVDDARWYWLPLRTLYGWDQRDVCYRLPIESLKYPLWARLCAKHVHAQARKIREYHFGRGYYSGIPEAIRAIAGCDPIITDPQLLALWSIHESVEALRELEAIIKAPEPHFSQFATSDGLARLREVVPDEIADVRRLS